MSPHRAISIQRKRKLCLRIHKFMKDNANKPNCNLTGLDDFIISKRRSSKYQIFWQLLFLFCICMLTYQTHNRIMYYLSHPMAVDVTSESEDVVLPNLMFCSGNTKEMFTLWNESFPKFDTEPDTFTDASFKCVNMVKTLMKNQMYDMSELWKATNMTKEIVSIKLKGYSNEAVVQREIDGIYGMCSAFKFLKNSTKSFVGKSLTVNFEKLQDYICFTAMYHVVLTLNDFGKNYYRTAEFSGSTEKINLIYNKYIFLNSSKNTCSSENEYTDCYRKCLSKRLEDSLTCRLPFITNLYIDLPLCNCSLTTHDQYGIALEIIETTDAIATCSCRRPCQQLIFIPYIDSGKADDKKKTSFSLEITNEKINVYKEWYTYDVIALLSDLGGNLGLFLGLSLISLAETSWYLFWVSSYKIPQKKHLNKIRHLYEKCINNTIAKDENIKPNVVLLMLKTLTITISVGFTLYYLKNRLNYYLEEPVTKTVTVVPRINTEYPSITICGETKNELMDEARNQLIKNANKTCENISPWQLFNDKLSLEDIWQALNVHGLIEKDDMAQHLNGYEAMLNVTKNVIALPFGNCSQVHADKSNDLTVPFLVSLNYLFLSEVCNQDLWYFLNHPEEDLNIMIPLSVIYASTNVIKLRIFKTVQKNTKRNPCEKNKAADLKCKNACTQNDLFRNINCRLPYMTSSDLKLCSTTKDAMNAHSTYLNNYNSNQRRCKCKQSCEKIFYKSTMHGSKVPVEFFTFIQLELADSFIENLIEKQKYPITQFLSDIGSIVGLTLGMSLLSLYICILKSYNWFRHIIDRSNK